MRLRKIELREFKRFTQLVLDLGEAPKKIVALVGPNGSGKSSIFDALEECSNRSHGGQHEAHFASKTYYQAGGAQSYSRDEAVQVTPLSGSFSKKSFYIRTAYRYTPSIDTDAIRKMNAVADDPRPGRSTALDGRAQRNYERLVGSFMEEVYDKKKTGEEWVNEKLKVMNDILANVLDIRISNLGNVIEGRGQLWFEKGHSKNFPYANLSAGEKEVIDIILDLIVKAKEFDDTVFCIDEPELHLNTSIQRKLLVEIEKLIPDNCQLWVATHSVGFLRALQVDLRDKTSVFDFTGHDFDKSVVLTPIAGARKDWARIFETALEDLTGLLAPEQIIYCEGRADPSATGDEQGLDASVYNDVFGSAYPGTLFVSSGGGGEVKKGSLVALKVLGKAFSGVSLLLLKDRDVFTDGERSNFLDEDPAHRMLVRREVENYLFDEEVLRPYCAAHGTTFDEARYRGKVTDVLLQDLKPVQQEILACCGVKIKIPQFKLDLAAFILPDSKVYEELRLCVFA